MMASSGQNMLQYMLVMITKYLVFIHGFIIMQCIDYHSWIYKIKGIIW